MRKGIGGHQHTPPSPLSWQRSYSEDWLTPRWIIEALGEFDLDPCTPPTMPWQTARSRFTKAEDGLLRPWAGRVWLNPPYGHQTGDWLRKLAQHGDGIALVFARTETEMFRRWVWPKAAGILFLFGRLSFLSIDGPAPVVAANRRNTNAGAPSVLIAYGEANAASLAQSEIPGAYVPLRGARVTPGTVVRGRLERLELETVAESVAEVPDHQPAPPETR